MNNSLNKYQGFVVYCSDNHPIGVVSSDSDKKAICNLKTMPKNFYNYLTAIEDKRFYQHAGVDIRGITRALYENIKARKIVQGGSTITQQLARNILRDNRKNVIRKVKEILAALEIENKYSKKEILELYCNNVFWGRNIYGLRTASLEYFSKEPERLTTSEQLVLLTLLRGPNYYLSNEEKLKKRYHLLNNTLHNGKALTSRKYTKAKRAKIILKNNNLQIYKSDSIPYITKRISQIDHSIVSSINKNIQLESTKYIDECEYPTSIICFTRGEVLSVASTYGTDYPFIYRANVGSTLKPFIYTFLRENGFNNDELFSTNCEDNISWDIHEVQTIKNNCLTLKEALKLSNNNVFVNASYKLGIEKIQLFLSRVFNQPVENFVPASILGATVNGITLYELACAYYKYFIENSGYSFNQECISILKEIAADKFEENIKNVFLKTGTTNYNKERYGIVGAGKLLFGFLRQGNEINDYTKEGSFLSGIICFLKRIRNKIYKWD